MFLERNLARVELHLLLQAHFAPFPDMHLTSEPVWIVSD